MSKPTIKLSPESCAIALFLDDPTLTKEQIAARLGVHKGTVTRWRTFGRFVDLHLDTAQGQPLKGRVSRIGDFEAEFDHSHLNEIEHDE